MGGFTNIPKLKTSLGDEGVGDRIALFNSSGELVGYVLGGFLPLSGGVMTGDIDMSDSYLNLFFEGTKIFYISAEEGIRFIPNGGMTIQPNIINGLTYFFTFSEKGIVGHEFYNKQNDPKAFAQLGDIATVNSTATALTLATLNSTYATQGNGFKVICPNINVIYIKSSLTTWEQFATTTVI